MIFCFYKVSPIQIPGRVTRRPSLFALEGTQNSGQLSTSPPFAPLSPLLTIVSPNSEGFAKWREFYSQQVSPVKGFEVITSNSPPKDFSLTEDRMEKKMMSCQYTDF